MQRSDQADIVTVRQGPPEVGPWPPGGGSEPAGSLTWRWQGDLPADSCVRVGTVRAELPGTTAGCELALDLTVVGDGLRWSHTTTADVAAV